MKVFIAGSMYFAKEMLKAQKVLEGSKYEAIIPSDTHECLKSPELNMDEKHCFETDIMRDSMNKLEMSDALIVLNYPKDNVEGYIGGAVLIEIGLAYFLKKKIFLLFPPPSKETVRYSQEVLHVRPIILNGELERIFEYL
ncbi:hypothetical protein KKH43_05485 [Patescibacteria group bacterium]|nr:hypothetical protein [Patescibacteria group bacterium]